MRPSLQFPISTDENTVQASTRYRRVTDAAAACGLTPEEWAGAARRAGVTPFRLTGGKFRLVTEADEAKVSAYIDAHARGEISAPPRVPPHAMPDAQPPKKLAKTPPVTRSRK